MSIRCFDAKYLLLGGFPWTFLLVLFFVANVLFRNRFHSRDLKTISIYTSNEKKLEINILNLIYSYVLLSLRHFLKVHLL